jgi:hypothetical protein
MVVAPLDVERVAAERSEVCAGSGEKIIRWRYHSKICARPGPAFRPRFRRLKLVALAPKWALRRTAPSLRAFSSRRIGLCSGAIDEEAAKEIDMPAVLDAIIKNLVPLGVLIVFGGTIIGIFRSKTPGFGKYTTSALILTLIMFVAAMALVEGKVEWMPMANILFAIAGFAGGLITARSDT